MDSSGDLMKKSPLLRASLSAVPATSFGGDELSEGVNRLTPRAADETHVSSAAPTPSPLLSEGLTMFLMEGADRPASAPESTSTKYAVQFDRGSPCLKYVPQVRPLKEAWCVG